MRIVDPVSVIRSAQADVIVMATEFVDPEFCRLLHEENVAIEVLTNDPNQAALLSELGVDIIDTDVPDAIRKAVYA